MAKRRGQRILMAEYSMRFMGIENQPVCNPDTLQTLLLNKHGSFSTFKAGLGNSPKKRHLITFLTRLHPKPDRQRVFMDDFTVSNCFSRPEISQPAHSSNQEECWLEWVQQGPFLAQQRKPSATATATATLQLKGWGLGCSTLSTLCIFTWHQPHQQGQKIVEFFTRPQSLREQNESLPLCNLIGFLLLHSLKKMLAKWYVKLFHTL